MQAEKLTAQIFQKKSFLCIGLDTDLNRIPEFLQGEQDPVFEFNKRIIEATSDLAVAYKPNLAFYEAMGPSGWRSLERTLEVIPDDIMVIADAKRGDIGNTARKYAETFFQRYDFEAVTVAPYMGKDSVQPFLEYEDKWVFLLALTSNAGAQDFQYISDGKTLHEHVLEKSQSWANESVGELGFVVGATRPEDLGRIRQLAPKSWFLVPGVGAQGGTVEEVASAALTDFGGLLVNSSRGIIYASNGADFAQAARNAALNLQQKMAEFL
ncbi:MAG: orotidine-5'-phosphate decarboxylase [Bacteroidia bacterium]|nr:orotidine-5'-phosphate decarboxylase [Bacteroidia bacterium]